MTGKCYNSIRKIRKTHHRRKGEDNMSDKSLRFMDKTQLLNIMRQQELEIDRLTAEVDKLASGKDEQIENLTYGSEKLLS